MAGGHGETRVSLSPGPGRACEQTTQEAEVVASSLWACLQGKTWQEGALWESWKAGGHELECKDLGSWRGV